MNRKFFNLQRFAKKISLTSGADNYENKTSNRIIYALGGGDTVTNYANKITIFGGAGDDNIKNDGSYLGINGGDSVKISGGAGKDSVENYEGDSVSIDGGKGVDYLKTWWSDHVTIAGGAGNDSIQLGAYESLESATAKNTVIKYASGDGNDTIFGFDSNDTLYITKGTYSTSVKGDNFIVTVGKQKIILKNAAYEKIIIKNSSGELDVYNDWKTKTVSDFTNSANDVTLKSAKAGSYITNCGDNVSIKGNNGADEIHNSGNNATIFGGKGKDIIAGLGNYCSISGGAGNDQIGSASIGNYNTINGGKGNDYISMLDYYDENLGIEHDSYQTVVQYASGDGKDTIRGFNSDDTLQITSGTYSAASNSDNNVIITVGKGSITLLNATDQDIYITGADGMTTKHYFSSTSANLSELVTENNLSSLGDFETKNFENLTQENLITFAEK